jgi:hypothetical protein
MNAELFGQLHHRFPAYVIHCQFVGLLSIEPDLGLPDRRLVS